MDNAPFSFESFFNHCLWYMLDNSVDVYGDKLKMRYDRSDINSQDLKYLESILYAWYYKNIGIITSVSEVSPQPIKVSFVAKDVLLFMNSTHRFPASMYGKKQSEKLNENSKSLPKEVELFDYASGKLNLRSY